MSKEKQIIINLADELEMENRTLQKEIDRLQKENEELKEKRDIEVNCYTDKMNFIGENVEKVYEIKDKKINEQDKVIDLMAEHIFKNSNNLAEYFCNGIPENICEARGNTEEGCRYCIKLYFYKQVEVKDE